MNKKYITLRDGKKIYTQIYNEGHRNSLIILHGGPGAGCYEFQYLAEKLSEYINVILFDERGVLRSERIKESDDFSMEYLLDDIEDIKNILKINRCSILGHSFGGMIALMYAAKYPDSVESIIFNCPSFNINMSMKSAFNKCAYELNSVGEYLYAVDLKFFINKNNNIKDIINEFSKIPEAIRNKAYHYSEPIDKIRKANKIPNVSDDKWENCSIHFNRLLDEGRINDNFPPLLTKMKCRSILLAGLYDPVCTKEQQEYYLRNTLNSKVVIFDKSGHFPHNDEPDRFIDTILNFLSNETY